MKKLLSAAIAVILALSCTVSAFAATDSASPDEPKTVESIDIKKLPDKLVYNDNDVTTSDEGVTSILEMLELEFALALDLTGAEIEATYSDGSVENVNPDDCTATLVDGFKMSVIFDYLSNMPDEMTEEAYVEWLNGLNAMIYRDYTVQVEYMGAKDTYTIKFEQSTSGSDPDYPPYEESIYEVVSVKKPDKLYYTKDDVEVDEYDEDDNMLWVSYEGLEVVVRNTETGELTTVKYDADDGQYLYIDDIDKKNQTLTVEDWGFATDDSNVENDYFEFSFDVYYNFDKTEPTTAPTTTIKPATNDTVTKSVDNGAIQTGTPTTAIVLVVLLLSGSAALFFAYRRKIEK